MEIQLESRMKLVDIEDQLAHLPANLEIEEDVAKSILSQVQSIVLGSESIGELEKLTHELLQIFKHWDETIFNTSALFQSDLNPNNPLYTDPKYTPFHKLRVTFPEIVYKSASLRMYELMKIEGIRMSSYKLLDSIHNVIHAADHSGFGFEDVRNVIHLSMLMNRDNIQEDLDPDTANNDENTKIQALKKELISMPIIYDSLDIGLRDLQKFKLIFDDLNYGRFTTNTLAKRALPLD